MSTHRTLEEMEAVYRERRKQEEITWSAYWCRSPGPCATCLAQGYCGVQDNINVIRKRYQEEHGQARTGT